MILWILIIVTSMGQVQTVENISTATMCQSLGDRTVTELAKTPAGGSYYTCQSVVKLNPI